MHKKLLLITSLSLLFISAFVFAAPGIPNRFHGYVNFLNGPAPNGLLVEAKIDGTTVANITTVFPNNGKPAFLFDVTDPDNNRAGKNVTFYVQGNYVGSATFINGESTELNFTINGYVNEIPPADKIENKNVTVAPASPAVVRLGNDMNITLSSTSADIISIKKVEKLSNSFYTGQYTIPSGKNVLNGYEINIVGNVNITVVMKYSDAGIDETTVKPYKYDGTSWVELPILYRDAASNTITFAIPSAQTPYAIFASPIQAPVAENKGGGEGLSSSSSCTPNWSCSKWSPCINNLQTRTCNDLNKCGTTNNRPVLSQNCTQTQEQHKTENTPTTPSKSIGSNKTTNNQEDKTAKTPIGPTGLFLGINTQTWLGIIIGIIIIGLIVYILRKKKQTKKSNHKRKK